MDVGINKFYFVTESASEQRREGLSTPSSLYTYIMIQPIKDEMIDSKVKRSLCPVSYEERHFFLLMKNVIFFFFFFYF